MEESKARGKPERFAEHYNQARLFWKSQSDVERAHIVRAFRFELTKVQTVAVRQRVVAQLRNVAEELARGVAGGLGMTELPDPLPSLLKPVPKAEVETSPSLSLFARPGQEGIKTRRIAMLVADGVDGEALTRLHAALVEQGAVPRFVGIKLGEVRSARGDPIVVEVSLEAAPSVLWDAAVLPDGQAAVATLSRSGHAIEFIKDQYRHCKPILVLGASGSLLETARIPVKLPSGAQDPALLRFNESGGNVVVEAFAQALARHRCYERETDPPII